MSHLINRLILIIKALLKSFRASVKEVTVFV